MVIGAMLALVFSFVPRIAVPRLGEIRPLISVSTAGPSIMGYAFASQGWMLYGWMAVFVFIGLSGPDYQRDHVAASPVYRAGRVAEGALASLGSLTSVSRRRFYQISLATSRAARRRFIFRCRIFWRACFSRQLRCYWQGFNDPAAASGHVINQNRIRAIVHRTCAI